MHPMEKHRLLMDFDAPAIQRALGKLEWALRLKRLKVTETLKVVGFDLAALEDYSYRRYDLQKVMEQLEEYAADDQMNECDLAVCRATWQWHRDYRKKLMILMEKCEVEHGQQEAARNLLDYGKLGAQNASS